MAEPSAEMAQLRAQIKDGLGKIDRQLQQKSRWQRVQEHLGRNSNALTNVVLAACVAILAYNNMQQRKQSEVPGRALLHAAQFWPQVRQLGCAG